MRVSNEKLLDEEFALKFNAGLVDKEAEDLEDPGDHLEEADTVSSTDHEDSEIVGVGVLDKNFRRGGGRFAGGGSHSQSLGSIIGGVAEDGRRRRELSSKC